MPEILKELFEMDWSQAIPNLVVGIILSLIVSFFGGLFAYSKSVRFKVWFDNLIRKIGLGLRWFVDKWYFFIPLLISIFLGVIIFRNYQNWDIIIFSSIYYVIGLLSWKLSNIKLRRFRKNRANDSKESEFRPIPLPLGFGNKSINDLYINPPIGDIVLGGKQFHIRLDSIIFDTNEIRYYSTLDDGGKEVDFQFPQSVSGVKAVYFLINSGNSQNIYANQKIGKIRLIFKNAPPIDVNLILGENIREWCIGNSGKIIRKTTSPATGNVWSGNSNNGENAVIDCLKIPVYECMQNSYLEKIVFVHKSDPQLPDTLGVHFLVYGISLEI